MKILYANIVWFIVTILGLLGATIHRHTSPDWEEMTDVAMKYDIAFGCLALYLAICAAGLLAKRKWSYKYALSANATLAIIPFALFVVSIVFAFSTLDLLEILKINGFNLAYGAVGLFFWIAIVKTKQNIIFFND